MKVDVKVVRMSVLVAVALIAMPDEVVSVLLIVIAQSVELRVAESMISVMNVLVAVLDMLIPLVVEPTNTAVDVESGTAIRYHAVPSLAMAQSLVVVAVDVTGKNKLETLTVFGVAVTPLNVTAFVALIAHDPVNVQTRKTF
jgi:hypothetical protein